MKERIERTHDLMRATGITEEPFGVHYADTLPEPAFGPSEGPLLSREMEERGEVDFASAMGSFSCLMGNVWLARRKKRAAFISRKQYGCFGGSFYCGFLPRHLRMQENYVSTGIPGTPMHGERYIASPEAMCRFLEDLAPPPAPAQYCILKPLSLFSNGESPEYITFFARMESITGLQTMVYFVTGDHGAVEVKFGSACAHMVSWPRAYAAKGVERAVLGGCDPSARKFMKTDEMLLTIPLGLYDKMLASMPESLLGTETWKNVMKKVGRSNKAWDKS